MDTSRPRAVTGCFAAVSSIDLFNPHHQFYRDSLAKEILRRPYVITRSLRLAGDLNSFVFRITDFFQITLGAVRFARKTHAPPVPDHLVRELDPLVLRDYFHQVLLDLFRLLVLGQVETIRKTDHVRVHYHAYRNT